MYSSRVPDVPGSPVSTCVVAGAGAGGTHAPALAALPVTRIAATTRPELVVTWNAAALAERTSLSRTWTTMACGGTRMPESWAPSLGPLSLWPERQRPEAGRPGFRHPRASARHGRPGPRQARALGQGGGVPRHDELRPGGCRDPRDRQ